MPNVLKHKFTSPKPQTADPTMVGSSQWNDEHVFAGGSNGQILQRDSGQTDGATWTSNPSLSTIVFPLTTPGAPVAGAMWLDTEGTTPDMYVRLKARLNGADVVLLEIGPI
jgi:hypothetical protein